MRKLANFVLGILLILAGAIPLLQSLDITLAFLPGNIIIYQIATIVLGLLVLFFTFRKKRKYLKA